MVATGSKHSRENPLNREPPVSKLVKNFLTPQSLAYDRNHGPIPYLNPSQHSIRISGHVPNPCSLGIASLRALPQYTVVCALQCAGNRRASMSKNLGKPSGIEWGDGAVMNCAWRGPLLADVLGLAGVDSSAVPRGATKTVDGVAIAESTGNTGLHAAFSTRAQATQDDDYYGASIPLARALDRGAEVVLALEVNGEELLPERGAPVRVVVPGVAGARSVKWVEEICVQQEESACVYQRKDYKVLPKEVTDAEMAKEYWDVTPALQAMPVNSVVGVPESSSRVRRDEDGCVQVAGYALASGDEGPVWRVQVSGDEGETWVEAELSQGGGADQGRFSWCLWKAKVKVKPGKQRMIFSRAMDKLGVWQERKCEWNFRGIAYNGYGEASDLEVV